MSTAPTAFCQHCGQPLDAASRFCNHCGQPQPAPAVTSSSSPFGAAVAPSYAANATVAQSTVYAGFWMRFLAVLIDGVLVSVVTGPVIGILQLFTGFQSGILNAANGGEPNIALLAGTLAMTIAISVAANALYEAFLMSSSKQSTVGKMVFRIKVTDVNGGRISFGRALGRHFAKYVSSMAIMIGYLMQPFTARRQALHDMIAGTVVTRDVGPAYAIVPPQQTAI